MRFRLLPTSLTALLTAVAEFRIFLASYRTSWSWPPATRARSCLRPGDVCFLAFFTILVLLISRIGNALRTFGVPNWYLGAVYGLVVTLDQLREARRFVTDGEQCMVAQRKIVEWLEHKGYDTLDAILFLEYLEEMQDEYVDHRDRLEHQVLFLVRPE